MSKIGIPNACNEDWARMNTTEQGAFCRKCNFEVIDFRHMDPDEIRAVLLERKGLRTCAHINSVQIDLVNTNYHLWENQSVQVFKSKFLFACFMVFGIGLFTGCTGEELIPSHNGTEVTIMQAEDVELNFSKSDGEYTLPVQLGRLEETEEKTVQNNFDALGNYSVTTRLKGKLIDR